MRYLTHPASEFLFLETHFFIFETYYRFLKYTENVRIAVFAILLRKFNHVYG